MQVLRLPPGDTSSYIRDTDQEGLKKYLDIEVGIDWLSLEVGRLFTRPSTDASFFFYYLFFFLILKSLFIIEARIFFDIASTIICLL